MTDDIRVKNPSKRQAVAQAKPKKIDEEQFITVVNGFHGELVYESKKTGEMYIWGDFGDTQEVELRELRSAKSLHKQFYANNWFMFKPEDEWVIDYLGIRKYYGHTVSVEEFDKIFAGTVDEIKEHIASMTGGQKESAAFRARELVQNGAVDSLKTIAALEESLGIELIER